MGSQDLSQKRGSAGGDQQWGKPPSPLAGCALGVGEATFVAVTWLADANPETLPASVPSSPPPALIPGFRSWSVSFLHCPQGHSLETHLHAWPSPYCLKTSLDSIISTGWIVVFLGVWILLFPLYSWNVAPLWCTRAMSDSMCLYLSLLLAGKSSRLPFFVWEGGSTSLVMIRAAMPE